MTIFFVCVLYTTVAAGTETAPADQPTLQFRVTDPDGRSVSGATICRHVRMTSGRPSEWEYLAKAVTDESGRAELSLGELYRSYELEEDQAVPVYAFDESVQLVGIITVAPRDGGREREIRLEPPCLVRGEVQNPQLEELGRPLDEISIWVILKGLRYTSLRPISFSA